MRWRYCRSAALNIKMADFTVQAIHIATIENKSGKSNCSIKFRVAKRAEKGTFSQTFRMIFPMWSPPLSPRMAVILSIGICLLSFAYCMHAAVPPRSLSQRSELHSASTRSASSHIALFRAKRDDTTSPLDTALGTRIRNSSAHRLIFR